MNTKNIKPFDLEAALKGEPVMLRDGSKAFIRHHETEEVVPDSCRIWGFVRTKNWDTCTLMWWTKEGRCSDGLGKDEEDIVGMWPKNRIVNGFEVPAPESKEPNMGNLYFIASTGSTKFYESCVWNNDKIDESYMERGLVFLNKEGAIANTKAMLGINPYDEGETLHKIITKTLEQQGNQHG